MNVNGQEFRGRLSSSPNLTPEFLEATPNWRGPIWMPIIIMIIRALQQYILYYGDNFKIECPNGSEKLNESVEVSMEISQSV